MPSPLADKLPELRLVHVDYGDVDAVRLVAEVQAEYVVRYGSQDDSPLLPLDFVAPAGAFFVGYLGDRAVATGAWRRSDVVVGGVERTAEIKRMYVAASARGQGLARRVLQHLEESAAAAGYEALVLETGIKQPEAIALYESSGYVGVPGFGHYRGSPLSRCFAKVLAHP
ncbi:GNAT family N-acetyltransferase [Nocardioides sp.]|uniref:GNAT family N-acetyltransferase n=1 Tax=Nocardioides sp. TaxID=35761 RepID=UPI002B26B410|nr:GNAT family N-acetyltransferase [Nocardioides sp.]